MIRQLAPASTVLPHFFLLVKENRAKSPLVAMLLMFNVATPELVRVAVFAPLVTPTTTLPHVNEVGDSVTAGPLAVTARLNVVVEVRLPDVPVMVTVDVPVVARPLAVKVNVLVEVVGFGVNPAITPLGRPEALKVTLPLKPFSGTTVMALVALALWATVTAFGFAFRVKSGLPRQTGKTNDPMRVLQLKAPLVFWYWFVYQKVQSSVGSTWMPL